MPARHGGTGLIKPTSLGSEHEASKAISGPLVSLIVDQKSDLDTATEKQRELKKEIKRNKRGRVSEEAKALHDCLPG